MNIKQAKDQIRNAVIAYRTKNVNGRPMVPQKRQRPIFLVGAPGLGKTAIVEQIAEEMGIGLVSYSITHHTRQSALGLPFIRDKEYEGETFRISEYTMSEIIASCYEKMKKTGVKEGILFLDEINCVSETLMPAMLQFLQYKTFGQHKVPEGWIIVTAGNQPEYNQSVREFDMVTSDRLKRIDVEPDYEVWSQWAQNAGVHACILSYLNICQDDLYHTQATVDGREFVTPRAWVDLSDMIRLYEINGIEVDELLIGQYLQSQEIARQFAIYYQLWNQYSKEYQVREILEGTFEEAVLERARKAPFDERVTLIGLLLDALNGEFQKVMKKRICLEDARPILNQMKDQADGQSASLPEDGGAYGTLKSAYAKEKEAVSGSRRELLGEKEEDRKYTLIRYLEGLMGQLREAMADEEVLSAVKADYSGQVQRLASDARDVQAHLEHVFAFCEEAFGAGQEILMVVTALTSSEMAAKFIARYGSPAYYRHNQGLLFYERNLEIMKEIEELGELE